MPPQQGGGKQTAKASLFKKLGDRLVKAHEEVKNNETTYSAFGDLPPGIEGGVAQLVDIKIDEFKDGNNKGQLYFMAQGVVISPKTGPNGEMIEGLRTRIGPEPLCDTVSQSGKGRQSFKEHLDWVYNELRKLGVETAKMDPRNLEATLAALKEAAPHFKFRTWKGKATPQFPNPRTNHDWGGYIADYHANGEVSHVQDESGPATEVSGGDEGGGFDEFSDVDSLVKKAEGGDETAREQLQQMAIKAGATEDDVNNAPDWAAVAALISGGDEGGAGEEEPSVGIAVGDMMQMEVLKNPKNPKLGKKKVDVEVVKVDAAKQTADVKDLVSNKVVAGVKWDALTVPEQ